MPPPPIGAGGPQPVTRRAVEDSSLPAGAIDVATLAVNSAEFKRLPRAYQRAVTDAKAWADQNFKTMAPPPRVLVTPSSLEANGGHPVTVVVPPGAKAPVSVQTHYHGDFARSTSGVNGAADAIAERIRGGDRTVYVLPEARSAGGKGTDWNNAGKIGKTTDEALQHAGLSTLTATRTISVHSAGGRALLAAIRGGEKLKADQLVIQDALYEPTATGLREKLPGAAEGVERVTLQPTRATPHDDRTEALRVALAAAGRNVDVAPKTQSHASAAGQLRPAPPASRRADLFVD